MIAPHPLARLSFKDCRIAAASRLGAEGEGFRIAMSALVLGLATLAAYIRIGIAHAPNYGEPYVPAALQAAPARTASVTSTEIDGDWSDPVYLNSSGFDPSLFHDDDGSTCGRITRRSVVKCEARSDSAAPPASVGPAWRPRPGTG